MSDEQAPRSTAHICLESRVMQVNGHGAGCNTLGTRTRNGTSAASGLASTGRIKNNALRFGRICKAEQQNNKRWLLQWNHTRPQIHLLVLCVLVPTYLSLSKTMNAFCIKPCLPEWYCRMECLLQLTVALFLSRLAPLHPQQHPLFPS